MKNKKGGCPSVEPFIFFSQLRKKKPWFSNGVLEASDLKHVSCMMYCTNKKKLAPLANISDQKHMKFTSCDHNTSSLNTSLDTSLHIIQIHSNLLDRWTDGQMKKKSIGKNKSKVKRAWGFKKDVSICPFAENCY